MKSCNPSRLSGIALSSRPSSSVRVGSSTMPITLYSSDIGRSILGRDRSDEVDIYDKQHDIGGVDLPDPLEDAGHRHEQASFYRHLAVKHRRGVTGREEKEIRGATEPEIPWREQAHHVIRN